MIKKVLLINSKSPKGDHIQPSLGLGYLATALRKENFEVLIFDANKEKADIKRLKEKIKEIDPDAVGFQVNTLNIKYVKEGLLAVKTINPKIVTIVGGPHVSAQPERVFALFEKTLDFGFCGEAEIGLPKLLKSLNLNNLNFKDIPGLIFKKNKRTLVNDKVFHKNIDDFGFPAWDLIKPQTYPEAQHGAYFEKFPIAPIITTRGCPFNCSFCAGKLNTGEIIRKRSVLSVLNEIKLLYKDFGIREFHIIDDNFTANRSFAKEILKGIKNLNLNASFAVPNGVRLNSLDGEILSLMKEAGFYLISAGIESGSNRILKLMNKKLNVRQIEEKIALIRNFGLQAAGFFILGYPGETEKEISQTINFSLKLGLLRANYFIFFPLPGTSIYQKLKKSGIIKKHAFENSSFANPNFSCNKNISADKLKTLQRKAFIKFYFLRPKVLIKNLLKIRSYKQLIFLGKRCLNWLS